MESSKEEEKSRDISGRVIDRLISLLFSKDSRKWILLLFVVGFILRAMLGFKSEFGADEIGHGTHAIGFIESGKLQIMDQDAVWFFLVDLSMKLFGVNVFGLRFLSILIGSLTILLVYLAGKALFDEKTGLMAAFIFTFSSFQLFQMMGLMDIPMAFFALFAMYLLILFFKTGRKKFFIFSWTMLGVAIMIKQIALMFIPAFVLFSLYYNKKHHRDYRIRQIFYAAAIVFLMVVPVLTFNYLLLKDKGITDIQFARFTQKGLGVYASIAHTAQPFTLENTFLSYHGGLPGFIIGFNLLYLREISLTLIFALAGIFFLYFSRHRFAWLLVLSFLFPFLFLSGTSLLDNHLVFSSFFIALLASLGISGISKKLKSEKHKKIFICLALALIAVFCIVNVSNEPYVNGIFGENHIGKLIDFKDANIEQNSLVVVDSRIYRGRIAFMFQDRHYLESSYFPNLMNSNNAFSGNFANMPVYFVEAVTDDSGWGTIKDQPDFNQSTESIADFFKSNAQLIGTIEDIWDKPHFSVYKMSLPLNPAALSQADSTHMWFFYPVAYNYKKVSPEFLEGFDDRYEIYNTFDSLLDKFAHLILYLEVFLALLGAVYLCYLFYKNA